MSLDAQKQLAEKAKAKVEPILKSIDPDLSVEAVLDNKPGGGYVLSIKHKTNAKIFWKEVLGRTPDEIQAWIDDPNLEAGERSVYERQKTAAQ